MSRPMPIDRIVGGRRWQWTFYISGVRVRMRGRGFARIRIVTTDPGGDYAREQQIIARVAALLVEAHVRHGIGITIGHLSIIRDHAQEEAS